MKGMAKVQIVGRVVKDPVCQKVGAEGHLVIRMSVVVNRWAKDRSDGQFRELPSYFECDYFGKEAEYLESTLRKGDIVAVEGDIEQQFWVDKKTGQKRSTLGIRAWGCQAIRTGKSLARPEAPGESGAMDSEPANVNEDDISW